MPTIRLMQRSQSQPQTQSPRGYKQTEVSGEQEKKQLKLKLLKKKKKKCTVNTAKSSPGLSAVIYKNCASKEVFAVKETAW